MDHTFIRDECSNLLICSTCHNPQHIAKDRPCPDAKLTMCGSLIQPKMVAAHGNCGMVFHCGPDAVRHWAEVHLP